MRRSIMWSVFIAIQRRAMYGLVIIQSQARSVSKPGCHQL
jgi:hypothetical protein